VNKSHPLREVFSGLESANGGPKGTLYKCDRIRPGDPKSNGLTSKEFCEAIEQDESFRNDLDRAMNITPRIAVDDYLRAINAEAEAETGAKKRGRKKKKPASEGSVEDQGSEEEVPSEA